MNENVWPLILLGGGLLAFLLVVSFLSKNYSLNNFKNKNRWRRSARHGALGNAQGDPHDLSCGPVPSPLLAQGRGASHGTGHHSRQHGRQKAQR